MGMGTTPTTARPAQAAKRAAVITIRRETVMATFPQYEPWQGDGCLYAYEAPLLTQEIDAVIARDHYWRPAKCGWYDRISDLVAKLG